MFRFVSGGYDCGLFSAANRAQKKYFFKHGNKRMYVRCDDFGRCWEMHCAAGTTFKRQSRSVPAKEAGEEERSTEDTVI